MSQSSSTQVTVPSPRPAADLVQRPALDSITLLAGQKQVAIRHGDELYSLRLTRNGKLILTK